jgi:hypothetical protein
MVDLFVLISAQIGIPLAVIADVVLISGENLSHMQEVSVGIINLIAIFGAYTLNATKSDKNGSI